MAVRFPGPRGHTHGPSRADATWTVIECEVPATVKTFYTDTTPETEKELKSKLYHYGVHLPKDYSKNPDRRYPCIFIASPGGNARMGAMPQRLEAMEWIAIGLVESKNASNLWLPNFFAAYETYEAGQAKWRKDQKK